MESRISIPSPGNAVSYRDRLAKRLNVISSVHWSYNAFFDLLKTHVFVDLICQQFDTYIRTIPNEELSVKARDRRENWKESLAMFSKKTFFSASDEANVILDEAKDELHTYIENQEKILRLQYYSLYRDRIEESHLQATATCLLCFRYSYLAVVHYERAKSMHNADLEKIQNSIKSFVAQYNGKDFFQTELDDKTYKATEGLEFSLGKRIQEWFNANGESYRQRLCKL